MSDNQAELLTINRQILAALQAGQRLADDLWSAQEIADYLKLSKSRVQSTVTPRSDFPRPTILPTADKRGCRRWVAKEVKAWAVRFRT